MGTEGNDVVIALDTNVLLRVLVDDDARQSARARALIDRALADGASLFISTIVLCETVWVLRSGYGATRDVLTDTLVWLLAAEQLTVESRSDVERATAAFAGGKGDFSDYLIRESARTHGAAAVATFDRALWKSDGFVSPDPGTWDKDLSLHERSPTYRARRLPRRTIAGASH